MFRSLLVLIALLLSSAAASAQNGSWDIFAGVGVQRYTPFGASQPTYKYGWDASITNRPYRSHRWVGGQVESSAAGSGQTSGTYQGVPFKLSSTLYTAMAGPIVMLPTRGVRPFAHLLLGGAIANQSISITGTPITPGTTGYFADAVGGGVDIHASRRFWVRVQADDLTVWQMNNVNVNTVRVAGGVVYSF